MHNVSDLGLAIFGTEQWTIVEVISVLSFYEQGLSDTCINNGVNFLWDIIVCTSSLAKAPS